MRNGGYRKKVLFVCIGNMIRSQMAEGFARDGGSAFVEAYSAGVSPAGVASEEAVMVMAEEGVDIAGQHSKGLSDVPLGDMDYIVNMSGYDIESALPSTFRGGLITWKIEDPLGRPLDHYRKTRAKIRHKVNDLLQSIWNEDSKNKNE